MNMVYFHTIQAGIQFLEQNNNYFIEHEKDEMIVKGNLSVSMNDTIETIREKYIDTYKKSIRNVLPSEKIILTYLLTFSRHFLKNIDTIQFNSLNPLESKVLYTYKTIINDINPEIYDKFGIMIVRDLEWNYPRTLGDTILLPDIWVRNIVLDYRNRNVYGIQRKVQTLIHEHIHLIQRLYRDNFNQIYERFDFYPITEKTMKKIKEMDFWKYKITNPDTPGYYQYQKGYNSFIPAIILKDKQIHPIAISSEHIFDLNKMREYIDTFGQLGQPYHPDEIFAEVLCNLYMKKQ